MEEQEEKTLEQNLLINMQHQQNTNTASAENTQINQTTNVEMSERIEQLE